MTRISLIATAVLVLAGVGVFLFVRQDAGAATELHPIAKREDAGYATSDSCRSCHPSQHSSWHASYHRTMTQPAGPDTVVASFDNVELNTGGQTARLSRRGDQFWVNTVDQDWEQETFAKWIETRNTPRGVDPFENAVAPRVDAQVVMTTGSHHFQAYWIRGKQGRELWQFPWRYHIAEDRWVHRKDVFLAPPEWRPGMWFRVWNKQCIYCHSTGPSPGRDVQTGVMTDTKVAELGISCEACHGPAENHIAFQKDNVGETDPIVNPAKLDHKKSAQICGQCHSHFTHEDPHLDVHGPQFRPGHNLFAYGYLETPPTNPVVMSRFWGDGANRSGGREFSGMSSSQCYKQGNLSCVSCHSMHESDPNDQLSAIGETSDACLSCHESFRDPQRLTSHTHHLADSSGSECYNCHMPHTNYALFKAIRSHQIDVPKVVPLQSNSRPNACNLCHLDQTLQWTANHLDQWYQIKSPPLPFDDQYISAGVLWALKGDAGQRVIAAWHFGWDPARQASGSQWMAPMLIQLMKDPYAAVRWAAFDSLRADTILRDLAFDFDAPAEVRDATADRALADWVASRQPADGKTASRWPRVLFGANGLPDFEQMKKLLADRDQRLVAGVE